MGRYRALLVANSKFYADPERLPELKAPIYDMARLQDALIHPDLGLFDREQVQLLPNARCSDVLLSMEDFFQSGEPEDTMLLYYSGHGQLDINNNFFLCASDTRMDRLMATGIRDDQVNGMMRGSPARTFVLILDCCSSGAWKSPAELLPDALRGSGRFLLSSSRAGQNSGDAGVETESSAFTKLLVEAMEEADLDTDQDGYVDIDEIYKHVERNLRVTGQQAQRDFGKSARSVALARRPRVGADTTPIAVEPVGPHEPPSLTVTPEQLQVTAGLDELPVTERIYVFNLGGGSLSWVAESDDPWIRLEPHDEFARVSLTPSSEGMHRGSIYVREPGGLVKQVRVSVQVEEAGDDSGTPRDGPDHFERGKRGVDEGRARWKWLVGIGASLLALVVVIAWVVVASENAGGPPDGETDQEQGSGHRIGGRNYLSWESAPIQPTGDGSVINGITPPREGASGIDIVAAGSLDRDAAIWTRQTDGWHGEKVDGDGDETINGVFAVADGFVAIGQTLTSAGMDAAVWAVEPDGQLRRVAVPNLEQPGDQMMTKGLPSDSFGLLVAGTDGDDGAVWRSDAPGRWTQEASGDDGLGGDGRQVILRLQQFKDADGNSHLLAVGYEFNGTDTDGAVWRTDEPTSWTPVDLDPSLFGGSGDQKIIDVVRRPGGGLVAVGYVTGTDGLDAAVWLSADGLTWERSRSTLILGGAGDQAINRIVAPQEDGLAYFVAGGYDEFRGDRDAALWYSEDGKVWRKQRSISTDLGGPGNQEIISIHRADPDLIAVGYDDSSGHRKAAIWRSGDTTL